MTRRSDASTVALLLAQRVCDTNAAPLKAREFWSVVDGVDDLASLLGLAADEIAAATSLPAELPERVAARLDVATAFALECERLEQSGIKLLSAIDDEFPARLPERLGRAAPPMLYVAGDVELLSHPSVGVVGSRDVGPGTAVVAQDAARRAAGRGFAVVSGADRGVDQVAMNAALEAGGEALGVLAGDLTRQLRDPEPRQALIDGRLCLLTPYAPTARFSDANAMGRNKLIYGLSDATLVVASDHASGGTWAGATEAIAAGDADVAVWKGDGSGPGNPELIAIGGRAVATLDDLFALVPHETPNQPAANGSAQLALDM